MSFIVKRIDLPKDSDVYILAICEKGDVYIKDGLNQYVPLRGARAVQIPKDHGGLIPLEDVFRAFPELEPYRQGLTGLTILEAE